MDEQRAKYLALLIDPSATDIKYEDNEDREIIWWLSTDLAEEEISQAVKQWAPFGSHEHCFATPKGWKVCLSVGNPKRFRPPEKPAPEVAGGQIAIKDADWGIIKSLLELARKGQPCEAIYIARLFSDFPWRVRAMYPLGAENPGFRFQSKDGFALLLSDLNKLKDELGALDITITAQPSFIDPEWIGASVTFLFDEEAAERERKRKREAAERLRAELEEEDKDEDPDE